METAVLEVHQCTKAPNQSTSGQATAMPHEIQIGPQ